MDHGIPPGDRVNIDALSRELEVSPTPVREALARLESDGLVRKRPLAGYTVAPLLTRAEFEELFDLRIVLETAAATRAATRAPLAARELALTGADLGMSPDVVDGYRSYADFTALDAQFHDSIAELAGNAMLRDAVFRLHAHLHLHRLHFPQATAGNTGAEHEAIVAAILAGDGDAAATAMHDHLASARARHLAAFE
ncbi:GntR family transcriptional regulator [Longispora fulva]|uniref:DNA-binding GntR family transcriptional regulator n=1 Tax=Longispora fulva TaxID=619741 RepID=A0A8J7G756_9ACTN|nr:DNA-binding GntR family transcriptional regulator [Longispora fulva]